MKIPTIRKPRCYMVHAIAPAEITPAEANRLINAMTADQTLPLSVWHDHFLGQPRGGMILFYVANQAEQKALYTQQHLPGWQVQIHPLIYSFSPSAFDAQTGYTLRAYRDTDWPTLRAENRPNYGERNLSAEAETGVEAVD